MNAERLAGLLGLMAGSEALGRPEEAQAGTYPWFNKAMLRSYYDFKPRGRGLRPDRPQPRVSVGFLEPRPWEILSGLDPGRKNMLFASPHPLVSRMKGEERWPIAKTIRNMEHLLNDPNAAVIPNINPLHGNAPYGVLSQKGNGFLFAPISPYRDSYYLNTLFGLDGKQVEDALVGVEGGLFPSPASLSPGNAGYNGLAVAGSQLRPISDVTPSQSSKIVKELASKGKGNLSGEAGLSGETLRSSHLRSQELPPAVAQRPGFSAVGEPAQVEGILGELPAKGKKNLPALAGASGAALSHYGAEPEPAHAFPGVQAYAGKPDLPLEAPWLDPVDMLVAPVGVPGAGAKVSAMAMAPAFSYGLERLGGLLGRLGAGE